MVLRDLASSALLLLMVSGLTLYFASTDLMRINPSVLSEPVVAVLINNDISELHTGNIRAAHRACQQFAFHEILTFGETDEVPSQTEVIQALKECRWRGVRIGLLYLTGHGSLYRQKNFPDGEACVMLKEAPLRIGDLTALLGSGPILVYVDLCYGPGWVEGLEKRLRGDFILLTDKPFDNPEMSCRGVSSLFWNALARESASQCLENAFLKAAKEICSRGIMKRSGEVQHDSDASSTSDLHVLPVTR